MRGAVDVVQGRQQPPDSLVRDPVEDRLCLAPARHQSFAPELRHMLRQSRLAQFRSVSERGHRQLSFQGEAAQDQEALVVADHPQDGGNPGGLLLKNFDPLGRLHLRPCILAIAKLVTANTYVNERNAGESRPSGSQP